MEVPLSQFRQWKKQRVEEHIDCSKKGAIDEDISVLVKIVNDSRDYFTTSSCSGRLVCYVENYPAQKKGCVWLLVSHQLMEESALLSSMEKVPTEGSVFFKFEPFVLHVCCRTLDRAREMMQWAVSSGFRNSGISIGRNHKIMLAVRSTHSLEAPVAHSGCVAVSEEYLKHLVFLGNERMKENTLRIQRFEASIVQGLEASATCDGTQVTHTSTVPHAQSKTSHSHDTTACTQLYPEPPVTPNHSSPVCTLEKHAPTETFIDLTDDLQLSSLFCQNDS